MTNEMIGSEVVTALKRQLDLANERISELKESLAEWQADFNSLQNSSEADERRISELEAEKAEILRFWHEDADPDETRWAREKRE